MVPTQSRPGVMPSATAAPVPGAEMGYFLLVLKGSEPASLAPALQRLAALPLLRLPHALLVRAPIAMREALADLAGVAHAGGVDMPARPPRRIRVPAPPISQP